MQDPVEPAVIEKIPDVAITSMRSMEEFNDYLKGHGYSDDEIQQFLKDSDWEDLYKNDEIDIRSNCSCSDDATFSVQRIDDLYIIRTLITPYEPEVRLFVDRLTCDRTGILGSFDVALGSFMPCYNGDQTTALDWSEAACDPNCTDPAAYDLHFELRRTGTWARDCDHQFFYEVECITP